MTHTYNHKHCPTNMTIITVVNGVQRIEENVFTKCVLSIKYIIFISVN
jgi:hypothetical protein